MKMKISELFDCGDEIAVIRERDDLFEPARIKELTMKKINVSVSQGETAHKTKARPPYRVFLIAAILARMRFSRADRRCMASSSAICSSQCSSVLRVSPT